MSIRSRRPSTTRLPLTHDDWLTVKTELTAGETRALMRESARPAAPGVLELDPIAASVALVVAYLLDWTFLDADSKPIVIADQAPAVVRAALDHLDPSAAEEVLAAISAHDSANRAARAEEKKHLNGAITPVAISPSVG